MKEFIYTIATITFAMLMWKALDLKFIETVEVIPKPYFIVETEEVTSCVDGSGKTHVIKTVKQAKVDMTEE